MSRLWQSIGGLALALSLSNAGWAQTATTQPADPAAPAAPADGVSKDPYKDVPVLPSGGIDYVPPETAKPEWPFSQRGLDFEPVLSVRQKLEDVGISWRFRETMFVQNLASGGRDTAGATDFTQKYNLDLNLDFKKLGLWEGGRIYLEMEGVTGQGLTREGYVGDTWGVDRVAGSSNGVYLKKYLFEQKLKLDDWVPSLRLRFQIGKMDVRDEFDRNVYTSEYRTQFLNRSFTNNPTFNFRDGTLGVMLSVEHDLGYIRSGVYGANPNERMTGFQEFDGSLQALWVGEVGLTPKFDSANGKLPGNYRFGLWYSGAEFQINNYNTYGGNLPIPSETGNNGFYLSFDQLVWKEVADDAKDKQGVGVFFKYGTALPTYSRTSQFFSMGANWTGPIPQRDDDVWAFGYNYGDLEGKYGANPGNEQVFETYYNVAVFPWLIMGPDLQYIVTPGGRASSSTDALLVGFRVYMVF